MIVTLTQQEREKFSAWLKQDAESNRLLIEQMQMLSYAEPIIKHKKQAIAACLIVARMLDSTEESTVDG